MAKKTYIGVNGVAKNVKNVYIGINGVAKKVKKIYIGVNGVAKECYSSAVLPTIVSWSSGSDAEITAMVQASDDGLINLSDYWAVNNERTVNLSSMSATYVGETHASQNVVMVLMDTNKFDLTTATSGGKTKCEFVVGLKQCLNEKGYMNSTGSCVGSWDGCARRNWCNNVFYNAIPSTLRSIFKQFKTPTATEYNGSTVTYSNDYFALFAEKEIYGSVSNSNTAEANVLSQMSYYTTASNRIKKVSGTAYYWWERSPFARGNTSFCVVNSSGGSYYNYAANNLGIAPFGCV